MISLRDYQVPVVDKASQVLFDKGIVLMAFECRCGKTLSSLFVANNVGSKGVLFITPKKVIPSIQHDYDLLKKDNPHIFPITIINAESILATFKRAEALAADLVHGMYPHLKTTGVKYKSLIATEKERQLSLLMPYMTQGVDTIIVDECHRFSAFPKPSGAQFCLSRLAKGKRVILLSGTPNPESHSMFFHEFAISEHSPWCGYKNFYAWARDGYVNVTERMVNGFKVPDYSDGVKDKILRDIADYTVTLTQQEAGFDTIIDERIISLNMSHQTSALINTLRRNRVADISALALVPSNGKDAPVPTELVAETPADLLNKIHQLSGGTIKVGDYYYIFDTTKADYLRDTFPHRHYAVFYSYKAERDLLLRTLTNVTEDWQQFQSDPDTIFIGQIRSVREGIKLDTAEFSVFYSMEYSYVSYAQGTNRIVSKERDTPSIIYFFTSQCRIEQMILDCVHSKKDFTLAVYTSAR